MDRSLIPYVTGAVMIASVLLAGGPAAPAFADDPNDGTNDSQPAEDNGSPQSPTGLPGLAVPGLPQGVGNPGDAPRVGYIAPPTMNLPNRADWSTASNGATAQSPEQSVLLPFSIGDPTGSAGRPAPVSPPALASPEPGAGEPATPQQTQAAPTTETSSAAPVSGIPFEPAPAATIDNPPGGSYVGSADSAPLLSQLLTPLVAILAASEQQVPIGGLIAPVLDITRGLPLLLSDVLVSTPPFAGIPAAVDGGVQPMTASLTGSGMPPADLAPTGMDVPQAPAPQQPLVSAPASDDQEPAVSTEDAADPLDEPVAYRAGYSDYLRNAGIAQITLIAVPGAVAILLFSIASGFLGYRQARAGHVIRVEGMARFLR